MLYNILLMKILAKTLTWLESISNLSSSNIRRKNFENDLFADVFFGKSEDYVAQDNTLP